MLGEPACLEEMEQHKSHSHEKNTYSHEFEGHSNWVFPTGSMNDTS